MALLKERLQTAQRYVLLALPVLLIGFGWVLKGANDASLASLLACALLIVLITLLAWTPRQRLQWTLTQNALPLTAALFFIAWTALTAWRFPADTAPTFFNALFHPAWRQFINGPFSAISISPYRTLEGLAALLGAIAAFALGALAINERRDSDWLARILTAVALGFAIYALALHFSPDNQHDRLWVNFGSANSAATLFGALSLFLLAAIFRSARGRMGKPPPPLPKAFRFALPLVSAPVSFGALVLCVSCLFLTASRAGIAATLLAAMLFCALLARPSKNEGQSVSLLPGLMVAIALLAFWGLQFAFDRLSMFDSDADIRRIMAETHWRAFLDRPILGHGMNSFHELNALYADPQNWLALRDIGAVHNIFIQMLEETGLIGAAAYTLMLAPPLFYTLSNALFGKSGREWSAATCAAFALAFIHGWVDFGLQTPAIAAFLCFMLGATSLKSKSPPGKE